MCSEEFFLNESGLVSRKVWNLWNKSIRRTVIKPAFRAAWKDHKLEENYDSPEFKNYINIIQKAQE